MRSDKHKEEDFQAKVDYFKIEKLLTGELIGQDEGERLILIEALSPKEKIILGEFREIQNPLTFENFMAQRSKAQSTNFVSLVTEKIKIFYHDTLLSQREFQVALASIALIVFASALYFLTPNQLQPNVYAMKGSLPVYLKVNGKILQQGEFFPTKPGDTLTFGHRSATPLFIQAWYQDDGGGYLSYLESAGEALELIGTKEPATLPQKIVLDSFWQKEKVCIVYSPKPFKSSESVHALAGKSSAQLNVACFDLINNN